VVLDSLPENDFACQELLEIVVDWLPKRYPSLFNRLLRNDTSGNTLSDGIFSKTTGETYVWDVGAVPEGKVALQILSR
jgi:Haem-dependent oxidative N-demethylase, alpha subunit-like